MCVHTCVKLWGNSPLLPQDGVEMYLDNNNNCQIFHSEDQLSPPCRYRGAEKTVPFYFLFLDVFIIIVVVVSFFTFYW